MNKEPMVRKQERREKIDEAIIINLIGGVDAPPRLVPKQAPVKSSPEPPPQETGAETCPAIAPTDKKERESGESYERLFLQPRKYHSEATCRIASETYEKLCAIVQGLGSKRMSVKAYVNNILERSSGAIPGRDQRPFKQTEKIQIITKSRSKEQGHIGFRIGRDTGIDEPQALKTDAQIDNNLINNNL